MTLSGVSQTILDGQIGAVAPITGDTPIVLGISSLGVAGTSKLYAANQVQQIIADLGQGPGSQLLALLSSLGIQAAYLAVGIGTAGSWGAVTHSLVLGTSVPTITGSANDYYRLVLRVITGGTIGSAGITFQYSIDGGATWSSTLRLGTATSFAVPNAGGTIAFAAGTLLAGDQLSAISVEPTASSTTLGAALTSLKSVGLAWDWGALCGPISAALAASVDSSMMTFESAGRYTAFFANAAQQLAASDSTWQTALLTDYATFVSRRVSVAAGDCLMYSPVDQSIYLRPPSWQAVIRACQIDPARYELGRVKGDLSNAGALKCAITDGNGNPIAHNEFTMPGLDSPPSIASAQGFLTLRTYPTKGNQVFITEGKMFAPNPSDFRTFRLRRGMDVACAMALDILTNEIQETPATKANGTITESYAKQVESRIRQGAKDQLLTPKRISGFRVTVDRTNNVITTSKVNVTISIQPLGQIKWISITIGYAATLPAVATGA